jgi:hypothetical protein
VSTLSDWPLIALAVAATLVALDAGSNLSVAIPAGVAAVVAAGLLFAGSLGEVAWRSPPSREVEPPMATSTLRAAFRSGRSGRLSIVLELDRIERLSTRPNLPMREAREEAELRRMSPSEFRAYLNARLDALEADRG